jgi:hypothetical protein
MAERGYVKYMKNRFLNNCLIVGLLPIVLVFLGWIYCYYFDNCQIPAFIVTLCCSGIFVIDIINVLVLYNRESKLIVTSTNDDETQKFRKNCNSFRWYMPYTFFSRYKNIKYLTFLYALFCSFVVYCAGIIATTLIIHLHSHGKIQEGQYAFTNLIFGEGAIISFVVFVLSVYTLINTKVIKTQKEIEIETVEDLFDVFREKLNVNNKEYEKKWSLCSDIFIYIYDYSTALFHTSDLNKFKQYRDLIIDFMKKYNVKYHALINNYERNFKYYKTKKEFKNKGDELIKQHLVAEQDFFLSYINKYLNDIEGKQLISFQPYDPEHNINQNTSALYRNKLDRENEVLKNHEIPDKNLFIANSRNESSVLFLEDLGLTRFFVTNLFVIQFVLGKPDNKNPAPAGFMSEDITLIERYKNAFEEYRKKIVLGENEITE